MKKYWVNKSQLESMYRLRDTLKNAHHTDIVVRKYGTNLYFEADWLIYFIDDIIDLSEKETGEVFEANIEKGNK